MKVRAEQQALAKWGLNFVIDKYLPKKLKDPKKLGDTKLGGLLSKSDRMNLVVLDDIRVENNKQLLTDGCGECSADLFQEFKLVYDGLVLESEVHHGVLQVRILCPLGLVKGCLIVNPHLPKQTIIFRH